VSGSVEGVDAEASEFARSRVAANRTGAGGLLDQVFDQFVEVPSSAGDLFVAMQ
jgi:hypothetical protein